MPEHDPAKTLVYHITHLDNLAGIMARGLESDALRQAQATKLIGYDHIKQRRLTQYTVPCSGNRFVGHFVPFYFCPRSPMLYTINQGNTGLPLGCQKDIVHLVATVADLIKLGQPWAFSDGNAGAAHANFYPDWAEIEKLAWPVIEASSWAGAAHQKMAEFLVSDRVSWSVFIGIGCYDAAAESRVRSILAGATRPAVKIKPEWYY